MRGAREGTSIYYSAANTHVQTLLAQALFHADHTDRDLGRETKHAHHLPEASRTTG